MDHTRRRKSAFSTERIRTAVVNRQNPCQIMKSMILISQNLDLIFSKTSICWYFKKRLSFPQDPVGILFTEPSYLIRYLFRIFVECTFHNILRDCKFCTFKCRKMQRYIFSARLGLIKLYNRLRLSLKVNRLDAWNNSTPLNLLNHQGSRTDHSLALPD